MEITYPSMISGEPNTLDLSATCEKFATWQDSELVNVILCHLPMWDCEPILTGIKRASWDALFLTEGG